MNALPEEVQQEVAELDFGTHPVLFDSMKDWTACIEADAAVAQFSATFNLSTVSPTELVHSIGAANERIVAADGDLAPLQAAERNLAVLDFVCATKTWKTEEQRVLARLEAQVDALGVQVQYPYEP